MRLVVSKHLAKMMLLGGLLLAWSAAAEPPADSPKSAITHGEYVMHEADCMACHTQPGGTPFAGGRAIVTPFGTLASPNITPDPDTGIGKWSDDDFYRAVHDGIGHGGEYLYPVMPYTSYTKMPRADVLAIKAYLLSLKPVYAPRPPNEMAFPFDIRETLLVWRELFFHPGTFKPDPMRSADWNRGAYLVEGPGHCGECHSPHNGLGAVEAKDSLAGSMVGHWLAPNISSNPLAGVGGKSVAEIETFLKTGRDKSEGEAFGPMGLVVHDSLRDLHASDIHAIAVYLKESPDQPAPKENAVATAADLQQGAHLYLDYCARCHQDHGSGIAGTVPNLAGNAAVVALRPNDVVIAILNGLSPTGGPIAMPGFAGALDDQQVADISNYIRTSWGNTGVPDTAAKLVTSLRRGNSVGAAGTEAARAFDCPAVGGTEVRDALATPAEANFIASAPDFQLNDRVDQLIHNLRMQRPGISGGDLVDSLNAAYCPYVADNAALSNSQKRAQLARFNEHVLQRVAASAPPVAATVVVNAPVPQNVMQQIELAAKAHHETSQQWIADVLAKHTKSASAGQN